MNEYERNRKKPQSTYNRQVCVGGDLCITCDIMRTWFWKPKMHKKREREKEKASFVQLKLNCCHLVSKRTRASPRHHTSLNRPGRFQSTAAALSFHGAVVFIFLHFSLWLYVDYSITHCENEAWLQHSSSGLLIFFCSGLSSFWDAYRNTCKCVT